MSLILLGIFIALGFVACLLMMIGIFTDNYTLSLIGWSVILTQVLIILLTAAIVVFAAGIGSVT